MVSGPCRPGGHCRQHGRRAPAYWRKAGRRHHYRRSFRPGRPDRGSASRLRLNGFPRRTGAAKSGGIMTDTTGQLDKTFNPAAIEARWYPHWESSGAFRPERPDAEPFTIVIPPPNVTGSLHIGHALDNTLQDILIRHARLKGKDALWVVGTDHAGIATQMVVEQLLESQGQKRAEIGREARSEEHTSELQSLMRSSYAVFCLKKKNKNTRNTSKR